MEETCSECAFDESLAQPKDVALALTTLATAIGEDVRALSAELARRRPSPGVWSPVEYLGHLRESMAFHRWLIETALAEDNPLIPTVDPDESVAKASYANADIGALVGQFDRRVDRLCLLLNELEGGAVNRTLTLDDRQLTVGLVARSAWHECHHHRGDIRRLGSSTL
ncbi:DinB family protein [Mycobacterium sp.]|uniref:DinB family protein n=1 Tax=Mycobacterium sp. TaxID=1785 RepID=UPI003C973258